MRDQDTPHPFDTGGATGIMDRPCKLCGCEDRHAIHFGSDGRRLQPIIMPQPSYAERQLRDLTTMIVRTSLEACTDIVTLQREGATRQADRAQEQWMGEIHKMLSDAFMASSKVVEDCLNREVKAAELSLNAVVVSGFTDAVAEANGRRLAHRHDCHDDLVAALDTLLARYTRLVNNSDCGHWNPEEEDEVIAARAAIARART